MSFTRSAVYLVVASLIDYDIPKNAGFFRPIRVSAPTASVVNLSAPAACAARALTGFRAADALYGALAQALPDRVFAAGDGGNTFVTLAGVSQASGSFVLVDSIVGAWGGRPYADGLQGNSPIAINIRNQSIEAIEATHPVRIERYAFADDSGGAGQYRGGLGTIREYRLLAPEAVLQVRADRCKVPPYGLHGGRPGGRSSNMIVSATSQKSLPSKFNTTLRAGDLYRHTSPGGGGWGKPAHRDPRSIAIDIEEGYVSAHIAELEYGFVSRKGKTKPSPHKREPAEIGRRGTTPRP